MMIELRYMNKCKSGIDHSRPDPYTLAFEPWCLTQHMVTHWEPPGLDICHRSTPLTGYGMHIPFEASRSTHLSLAPSRLEKTVY